MVARDIEPKVAIGGELLKVVKAPVDASIIKVAMDIQRRALRCRGLQHGRGQGDLRERTRSIHLLDEVPREVRPGSISLEGRDELIGASRLHQEALPFPEGRTGTCPRHEFSEGSEAGALAQADIECSLITHDESL